MSMSISRTPKDASYQIRRDLASQLGIRQHQDFSCRVACTLSDGTEAILLSTDNAGFRGIEGWFEAADGSHFSRSLGEIESYDATRTAR